MRKFRYSYSRTIEGRLHIWDVERLWTLAAQLPVRQVAVAELLEADANCWFSDTVPTIRAVAEHCRRIMDADLSVPLILTADGLLMDGGHRVARALVEGVVTLPAVRFALDPLPDEVQLAVELSPANDE